MTYPMTTLDEVCYFENGDRGKNYPGRKAFVPTGVPFINAGHFIDNRINVPALDYIPRERFDLLSNGKVKRGDILFCLRGSVGKHAMVDDLDEGAIASSLVIIRPEESLDRNYLSHYLQSHLCSRLISNFQNGAAQPNLSLKNLRTFAIPFPTLPDQKRIASILDQADSLREKRRAAITKLDELLQSVFLDMFGDPVSNPKEWDVYPFGEVTDSRLGKMLDKKAQTGEYTRKYLANYNVKWGRFELDELRTMDFTLKDQEEFKLIKGDILVCEGGEVGRCAIWEGELTDCYYQKALHRVRCVEKKCVPEYIQHYLWFMAHGGGFKDFVTSATIAHLTGVKLKSLKVPLPPIDLQKKFQGIVHRWKSEKLALVTGAIQLETLFSSLQQRAFRGEL